MIPAPITYEVRKIIEKDVDNKVKRTVTIVLEKILKLNGHLGPLVTPLEVFYPVWGEQHMVNLVNTFPPHKSLDHLERMKIAKVLKYFSGVI